MSEPDDHRPALRIRALHELRPGFRPDRDLWPQIQARIAAPQAAPWQRRHLWAAVAAGAVLIAVGVWIGRGERAFNTAQNPPNSLSPAMLTQACIHDARQLRDGTSLLTEPGETLAQLPPESRQKVLTSLATIHKAVQDIEAALVQDSGNTLLQELLISTCRDESRVLTEVHDAGSSYNLGKGV